MNKTIIININGIVFHIEEDAYEILRSYMTDVKRHFSNSADSLEITTDIEYRIAEMFSEILVKENKQVIVEQDVNAVLGQMGSVEDFESADEDGKTGQNNFGYSSGRENRRLFRDADDHLVAGVCSGIANYFDIDSVWIRLAFAVSVAFAGTGLIIYILLWMVVPRAITRADRMAMKGEKQNLQGFKKNFEEELNTVRQSLTNFGYEARPFVYKARDFFADFFHHLGIFLNGTGKVLLKLLGVFILLCCLGFTIFIIVAFISLVGFGEFPPFHDMPLGLLRHNHADYIYVAALLVAFIPVLSIIIVTLKSIFNTGSLNWSTGSTLLIVWLCAVGFLVFYIAQIAVNFREFAKISETVVIKPQKNNTYYLKMNDLKYFTAEDSVKLNIKAMSSNTKIIQDPFEYNDFDHYQYRTVHIHIEKADINQPSMTETFYAKGRDLYQAVNNAHNVKYRFSQQDSVLKFDYRLYGLKSDLWHDEGLDITLKLPLNSKVVIDGALNDMLDGGNMSVYECKNDNKLPNAENATFIMTDNGLQCKIDTLVTVKKDSVNKRDSTINHPDSTQKAQ